MMALSRNGMIVGCMILFLVIVPQLSAGRQLQFFSLTHYMMEKMLLDCGLQLEDINEIINNCRLPLLEAFVKDSKHIYVKARSPTGDAQDEAATSLCSHLPHYLESLRKQSHQALSSLEENGYKNLYSCYLGHLLGHPSRRNLSGQSATAGAPVSHASAASPYIANGFDPLPSPPPVPARRQTPDVLPTHGHISSSSKFSMRAEENLPPETQETINETIFLAVVLSVTGTSCFAVILFIIYYKCRKKKTFLRSSLRDDSPLLSHSLSDLSGSPQSPISLVSLKGKNKLEVSSHKSEPKHDNASLNVDSTEDSRFSNSLIDPSSVPTNVPSQLPQAQEGPPSPPQSLAPPSTTAVTQQPPQTPPPPPPPPPSPSGHPPPPPPPPPPSCHPPPPPPQPPPLPPPSGHPPSPPQPPPPPPSGHPPSPPQPPPSGHPPSPPQPPPSGHPPPPPPSPSGHPPPPPPPPSGIPPPPGFPQCQGHPQGSSEQSPPRAPGPPQPPGPPPLPAVAPPVQKDDPVARSPPPPPPPNKKVGTPSPPPNSSTAPLPPPPNARVPRPAPLGLKHTSSSNQAPKTKLKPFFWDKVHANSDQSMVWDQLQSGSFQFDEEMIESLFGYTPVNNSKTVGKELSSKVPVQFARILDAKKSQNLAISLKALNVKIVVVRGALLEGGNELSVELLQTLLKMAPTVDEELKLRLYTGDPSELALAEQFLKALLEIPFAFQRVDVLLFKASLPEDVLNVKQSFSILEMACGELKNNRLFLKLLEAVLKTGNRMNDGTFRGGAQAFKLDTLLKLSDVKGTDGKTTLLHFVVQEIIRSEGVRAVRQARERSGSISSVHSSDLSDDSLHESEDYFRKLGLKVVSGVGDELQNVKKAAGLDADALTSLVASLNHRLSKTKEFLNTSMKSLEEESGFHNTLKKFSSEVETEITFISEEDKRIRSLVKKTIDFFHGNSAKDEGLRLFVIVRDFLLILEKACKEVRETPRKVKQPAPTRENSSSSPVPSPKLLLFPVIKDRRVDGSSSSDSSNDES
ncbi:formin-like protein 11 isoform X2 [Zingiber officinale]|uniref:formin-like protein 11 isoform X2 n=1 Tax=Zingiber officinale TaxID=94328 RepID=UPI001C4A943F|nr:formin-like protein 11 isoform X2 [Zingiber officinale]